MPNHTHHRSKVPPRTRFAADGPNTVPPPHYYIGVDLGRRADLTAIAIIERSQHLDRKRNPVTFGRPKTINALRYLDLLPYGASLPDVVDHVCGLTRHPTLGEHKTVILNASGVAQPLVGLFGKARPAAHFMPVVIPSENPNAVPGAAIRHVTRREILLQLRTSMENRAILISNQLAYAERLIHELSGIRECDLEPLDGSRPWRSPIEYDFVCATALANWAASQ